MSDATTIFELNRQGVASLTLNRPERSNALSQALIDELGDHFTRFAVDDAVRVVVLRGAGKHFCAGADLGGRAGEAPARFTLASMMQVADCCPKPTIALVQGAAIGGGLGLVAACDVVMAAPEAFFSVPEVRLGMAPSPVLSALFMRATGARQFRRYGFSGERFSAARALELGFVSEIHAAGPDLEKAADRVIDAMLRGAPGAIAELKSRIAEYAAPPATQLYAPASRDAKHHRTAEADEGVAAFKEKRDPSWYRK